MAKLTTSPRHTCEAWFAKRGIIPRQVSLIGFNGLARLQFMGMFRDGPFKELYGDGRYDGYNPNRQVWGVLKDGAGIFAELT